MSATRSLEERLLEMEKKEQASREKAKRYAEKRKSCSSGRRRMSAKNAHIDSVRLMETPPHSVRRQIVPPIYKIASRLGDTGGAVESVLGRPIEEDELPKLITFL